MANNPATQAELLLKSTTSHGKKHGANLCEGIISSSNKIILWLNYLRNSESTEIADAALEGVQGAVIEVAGCLVLGLVRPALFSMRAEIDLILSWVYFKDHKVEWDLIHSTGEGFKLKSEILKYLGNHNKKFSERLGILKKTKTRKEIDPYRLLSAHVHGQSANIMPEVGDLSGLVLPLPICKEAVLLQNYVDEYISDILFAIYADKWASLPRELVDLTAIRFSEGQKTAFFS